MRCAGLLLVLVACGDNTRLHPGTWVAQSINDSGTPRELFAFAFRAPLQNLVGAWDPVMGATVLHGNTPGVIRTSSARHPAA